MATTTPNLNLVKPATTDSASIAVINNNMDIIDAIIEQTNTTHGGYVKYASGLMIQWGVDTLNVANALSQIASSGVYFGSVNFTMPQSFYNSEYVFTGCVRYSTGFPIPVGFVYTNNQSLSVYVYDFYARPASTTDYVIRWQAVGRWK